MKIKIEVRPSPGQKAAQLRELATSGIYRALGQAAAPIRDIMLLALKFQAPVKTGALRDDISAKQYTGYNAGVTLKFVSSMAYAPFVLFGTRPHMIYASPGKALRFFARDGSLVFAKSVSHPGTQANPFPDRAWDDARDDVLSVLLDAGKEVARVIASR